MVTALASSGSGNAAARQEETPQVVAPDAAGPRTVLRNGVYVLQIGDEIAVRVFKAPELDETVRIRPDGKISVVLLDDIDAAGATTKELTDVLTTRYAEFFRDPQVSVIVRTFANLRIYVGGEVARPGPVALVGHMTAVGAVMEAGGFKTSARMDTVMLLRNDGQNQPVARKLNLKDVIHKGRPDIVLRPFDVVFVPESRIRRVGRFVDEYIRQLIPINATAGFSYLLGPGFVPQH